MLGKIICFTTAVSDSKSYHHVHAMPHSFTWPQELSHLCPHAQLDTSRSHSPRIYDAISLLSDCVKNRTTCRECQVLLHLIEDFVPSWTNAGNKERCLIRLTHDRPNNRHYGTPPTVELFIDQLEEGSLWKRWQRRIPVGEFQLLRKTRCKSWWLVRLSKS